MIKRAFIGLTAPRLKYDLVEPDPEVPETIPIPPRLILLLNQRLDSTKKSLIKQGNRVKNGDRLFLYKDSTEYVLSPVNGTITSIGSYTGDLGSYSTYVVVEKDPLYDGKKDAAGFTFQIGTDPANRFLRGLPGSPPSLIFDNGSAEKIRTIVITGIDEDLLSGTNQYFLRTFPDDIKHGIGIIKQITGIDEIFITIPDKFDFSGEPEATGTLRVSPFYPNALPELITKHHLNKIVPAGKKPEDIGICFMSAEAVVSISRVSKEKKLVYGKLIRVIDKKGRKTLVNAVIGTPIHRIFKQLNIVAEEKDRIIIGGPMRGLSAYTLYHPVLPDMDTVIVQDKNDIAHVSDYPCINCGKCVKVCPANIPANLLVRFLEAGLFDEAADSYDLESCIECGLCAYVCTANIPLLQYIRLGKYELLKLRADRDREDEEAANA